MRLVAASGGVLAVGRHLPGRGAWLCRGAPACLEQALLRGALARALRTSVAAEQGDLRARLAAGVMAPGRVGGYEAAPGRDGPVRKD